MLSLVDTHAHLEEINDPAPDLVAAKQAGVIAIIAVGSDYESNQEVLRLAQAYPGYVYPALGLHPGRLTGADIDRDLALIEANIGQAVAIGEVGLDYHKRIRATADKDCQKGVLREILSLAGTHGKPAIIHSRYAWRDAFDIVADSGLERVVFHWYTGTSSVLRDIVSQGYYVSVTPAVEYHEEHRRAVRESPVERLLLETDTPVVYRRGSELEYESRPADVLRALGGAAALKGVSEAQIAAATTENALELFNLRELADAWPES